MRVLALLALLVAPCGAFLQGAAPGWGLALRSLSSPRGEQQPLCARHLVATGQDGSAVGGWGAGQAQVVAARWRVASCVTLRMEGRAGVGEGRGSAGTGRGRGGAKYAPDAAVGRGDGAPTRPSGGRGGYRGRGGGIPAKRGGGPQLTSAIKECRDLGELSSILQEQKVFFNHIHVSAAWVCLARIGRGRGGSEATMVLTALQDQTRDVLDQMGAREIANVHHSMAKLQEGRRMAAPNDERAGLLAAMQRRATATAGEFQPQSVANLLWALATMGERADRELLEAMQRRATASAGDSSLWTLRTCCGRWR
ncbi:hypothetical protein T484DRAFT_3613701 [Baffinella frigidus]|nr:hypothetical protein T484DRAFT_3613701 [Cryptophyta sp. CCMP2293]